MYHMTKLLGTGAALLAPFLMTIGFVIWDKAWKGSAILLNVVKCSLASTIFVMVSAISSRSFEGSGIDIGMLLLSAMLGITIGDNAWLYALQILGPRKVIICDCLKPFLAAVLGAVALDESVTPFYGLGIVLTIAGVTIISLEQQNQQTSSSSVEDGAHQEDDGTNATTGSTKGQEEEIELKERSVDTSRTSPLDTKRFEEENHDDDDDDDDDDKAVEIGLNHTNKKGTSMSVETTQNDDDRIRRFGYACAVVNVVFDVFGSLLTRIYGDELTTFEINSVRFGSAAVMLNLMRFATIIGERYRKSPGSSSVSWTAFPMTMTRREWFAVVVGIMFVTVGCPALSNYALFEIPLAMCLTLTSMGPFYALPLTYLSKKEPVSIKSMAASTLAFTGIAILYLL